MTPSVSRSHAEKVKSSLGNAGVMDEAPLAIGLSTSGLSACLAGDVRSIVLALLLRLGESVIEARLAALARGL